MWRRRGGEARRPGGGGRHQAASGPGGRTGPGTGSADGSGPPAPPGTPVSTAGGSPGCGAAGQAGDPAGAGRRGEGASLPAYPVRWWASLRLRIAAGVAVVAIGVSGLTGAVADRAAAIDGRERLRAQALDRLDSAVVFYESQGRVRFGAVVNDPSVPAELAEDTAVGRRASWFDGDTMFAVQRVTAHELISVQLPGMGLRAQRAALRWAFIQAAALGAAVATLLGWLLGTWLSRRLRAGSAAASQIAAGDLDARAAQPGHDEVALLTASLDQMADALQRRLEVERQFTADVAHELRSPVTGLVSAAELLPPDELGNLVRAQVARLRRLVEDLLEISRLDAAHVEIDWQEHDLGEVVAEALAPYRDRVSYQVSRPGRVRVESRRLDRIIGNLVRNALSHGAGPVNVRVEGTRVIVTDSGEGYPAELIEHGPRRFATFAGRKGSGLGLTIAAKHALAMQGRLSLANQPPPGRGACATVEFQPASQLPAGAAPYPAEGDPGPASGGTDSPASSNPGS